jgi:hypothetical protein
LSSICTSLTCHCSVVIELRRPNGSFGIVRSTRMPGPKHSRTPRTFHSSKATFPVRQIKATAIPQGSPQASGPRSNHVVHSGRILSCPCVTECISACRYPRPPGWYSDLIPSSTQLIRGSLMTVQHGLISMIHVCTSVHNIDFFRGTAKSILQAYMYASKNAPVHCGRCSSLGGSSGKHMCSMRYAASKPHAQPQKSTQAHNNIRIHTHRPLPASLIKITKERFKSIIVHHVKDSGAELPPPALPTDQQDCSTPTHGSGAWLLK